MKDYYAILGAKPGESKDTIKNKFRTLAQKHHPDKNRDNVKEAEVQFKEINEAWQILGDDEKRKKYDEQRSNNFTQNNTKNSRNTKKSNAPMGNVNFSDLMGQFDTFFGKAVKPSRAEFSEKNPLDGSKLFEKFMGIK